MSSSGSVNSIGSTGIHILQVYSVSLAGNTVYYNWWHWCNHGYVALKTHQVSYY